MNPFTEIFVWALLLIIIPIISEVLVFFRVIDNSERLYFYILCGVRRGANILIFISLLYLIENLLLSILIMLFIEIIVGIILYKRILKKVSLKSLAIYITVSNLISWGIIYGIFKYYFLNYI